MSGLVRAANCTASAPFRAPCIATFRRSDHCSIRGSKLADSAAWAIDNARARLTTAGSEDGRSLRRARSPRPPPLILHELLQGLFVGKSAEHVAVFVSRDAFRHVGLRPFLGDEGRDLTILDAADPDALPKRCIEFFARLGIGHVEDVVAVDVEAARPAELPPFGKEFSILVEDLDAVI